MSRLVRLAAAAFFVLAFLLSGQARAAGPEIGPAPGAAVAGAPLTAPRDEMVAKDPIPELPPHYVTKDLGWMTLSYPPQASERVETLLRDANDVKAQLQSAFAQPVLDHVTVRIAPTFSDMARLAPGDAPPPPYASGVAYHGIHLVLLTMMAPRGADATDLDEVFRHELAHVALENAVGGKHVPVWFNEGMAIWLSGERSSDRMGQLWHATLSDTLIPLADLDRSFPADPFEVNIAYAEAADFMRFLLRKSDRVRFAAMIERVNEGQTFDRAIADAYNDDLRRLEFQWHGDLEKRFSVVPILLGGGMLWMFVMGLFVFAWYRRKKRNKAILAKWEREEAIEDARIAAIQSAIAAAEQNDAPPPIVSVSLKTEHDGGWHTLH